MKEFLKTLFGVSGKEFSGFLVLIIIGGFTILYPMIIDWRTGDRRELNREDQKILDSLIVELTNARDVDKVDYNFVFSPNTITQEGLDSLGFNEQAIKQIMSYREKGGRFRIKQDLFKIYSIDSSRVEELYDFIDLPEFRITKKPNAKAHKSLTDSPKTRPQPVTSGAQAPQPFDINHADTAVFQTIKGIGPVLSKRIVTFRDKLGGFVDTNQLFEVYGLDSLVVFDLLEITYVKTSFKPKAILINRVDEDMLRSHPYISRQQARLIISYRNQHGDFMTSKDLEKVYSMNEQVIKKLLPYISWAASQ